MRLHIIACQVFGRELNYYCSQSSNTIEITWMPQGLHDTPAILNKKLSEAINEIESRKRNRPDAIILCYGLCSNGVVGLKSKNIPIVVPRTDDCIALFLGSQKRYLEMFEKHNSTYWLTTGWIEHAFIPSEDAFKKRLEEYTVLYGEDNADFLLEQDSLWIKNYNYCGYISSEVYENDDYINIARGISDLHNWDFAKIQGDNSMIRKIVEAKWNENEFLVCPPNHIIEPSFDYMKIKAVLCSS